MYYLTVDVKDDLIYNILLNGNVWT